LGLRLKAEGGGRKFRPAAEASRAGSSQTSGDDDQIP
jgi:hypothetical protein